MSHVAYNEKPVIKNDNIFFYRNKNVNLYEH